MCLKTLGIRHSMLFLLSGQKAALTVAILPVWLKGLAKSPATVVP